MAELNTTLTWHMSLTTEDFVLVSKALGGRLREEDVVPAKALCDSLTKIRAQITKERIRQANQLLDAIGASNEV